MRKLIATAITSLDGYYEGPGKNVMVMPIDETFAQVFQHTLKEKAAP